MLLQGTSGSSESGELMLSTDSVAHKDTEAAKEWPEEFILSTDSARCDPRLHAWRAFAVSLRGCTV